MKIGVISDTHDRLPTLRRALALFERQKVAAIFHAGDIVAPFAARLMAPGELQVPLHCIYGNNDGERQGLKSILPDLTDGPLHVQLVGRRIVMHHWIEQLDSAAIAAADVVISGHTHQVVNEPHDGRLTLNPGECCGWVTDRCTIAVVDLDELKADIIEVHP